MQNYDIIAIASYLKDGYTSNDIQRVAGYSEEEINMVKTLYMPINSQEIISKELSDDLFDKKTINVFCKFLAKGATDNQIYDIFGLHKKCTRSEFHKLCTDIRYGKKYQDISSQYKIPKRGNSGYKSPYTIIRCKKQIAKTKEPDLSFIKHDEEDNKIMNTQVFKDPPRAEDILPDFMAGNNTESEKSIIARVHKLCALLRNNPDGSSAIYSKITGLNINTVIGVREGRLYNDIAHKYGIASPSAKNNIQKIIKKIEN